MAQNRHVITNTPLIGSIIWPIDSCHFQRPWMILKVIRLLQELSNAIRRTFVRHFARFQLTQRVARSLGDSWASCLEHSVVALCRACERSDERQNIRSSLIFISITPARSPLRSRSASAHLILARSAPITAPLSDAEKEGLQEGSVFRGPGESDSVPAPQIRPSGWRMSAV